MRSKNSAYFEMLETFINNYDEEYGVSPSTREIADGTGLSPSTISRYLSYMRDHGMLEYTGHRNIQTKQKQMTVTASIRTPVLGSVSCGIPKFAEENIEEYVQLPVSLFGRGDFFLLRASGNSMIEAGINSGDLVLIRRQNYANPGQIVVALIDNEDATLKRFYPEPEAHQIRLHPENPTMSDIIVQSCIIQGVAVKVLKDL